MNHIMKKRDNFKAIDEMRRMLSETKKLTLEGFIMPEEGDDFYGDEEVLRQGSEQGSEGEMPEQNKTMDVTNMCYSILPFQSLTDLLTNQLLRNMIR